jgi:peptidoglycan DL-endopeptidase RipA
MRRALVAAVAAPVTLVTVAAIVLTGGSNQDSKAGSCGAGSGVIEAAGSGAAQPAQFRVAGAALVAGRLQQVGSYRGEQLVNAAAIIVAGQGAGLDDQAIVIGVMTAMGESSLVNIDRGDAVGPDSRGLFQQRDNGAWGSYQDRMNPKTAAANFFAALKNVPGWRAMSPTAAAHAVQRNADPFHYQPYWSDAVRVVAAITSRPGLVDSLAATGQDAPCQQPQVDAAALVGAGVGVQAYNSAVGRIGIPYSWGGGGPQGPSLGFAQGASTVGFDCSSLMQYAYFRATGVVLPRTAAAQRAGLPAIPLSQLQAGDLIFFHNATHVAISDGQGGFVHSPRTGKTVEHVAGWQGNPYWADGVDGAARPRA